MARNRSNKLPTESASDLYRELKKKGLHIRRNSNGRDYVLFEKLCLSVGCPDHQLQKYLQASKLTAEDFLLAFLRVAAPFVQMYQEIWNYLADAGSTGALKTDQVAVRFGFKADQSTTVKLEQFRRHIAAVSKVWQSVGAGDFPIEEIQGLFGVAEALRPLPRTEDHSGIIYYEFGKPQEIPPLPAHSPEFIKRIYSFFQYTINAAAAQRLSRNEVMKHFQNQYVPDGNGRSRLANAASYLHDLLPVWTHTFAQISEISQRALAGAEQKFNKLVGEKTGDNRRSSPRRVQLALDILDLPFWKHRWHTYEIWMTVTTLRALAGYESLTPTVSPTGLVLTLPKSAVVATFFDDVGRPQSVAAQFQTARIRPDLRICAGASPSASNTVAIVESKQRAKLTASHLTEVFRNYRDGSPNIASVIVCNYDDTQVKVPTPYDDLLVEKCRPGQPDSLLAFQKALRDALKSASVFSGQRFFAVLLDLSGSMQNAYVSKKAVEGLRALRSLHYTRVFGFSEDLVDSLDIDKLASGYLISETAPTELSKAFHTLKAKFATPDAVLVVTDGYYQRSADLTLKNSIECRPEDLLYGIDQFKTLIMQSRIRPLE